MSLTGALYSTLAGLQNTEGRISVLSTNVNNADTPGYTRKELESQFTTINGITGVTKSSIETVNFDPYLLESLVQDTSVASYFDTINQYLSDFSRDQGSVEGGNSVSAFAADLMTAIERLSVTPEDSSLKSLVIGEADRLATEMRRLSRTIQEYRLLADQGIESAVVEINDITAKINDLNKRITVDSGLGNSTATFEDERRVELEKLSSLVDVDYFINDNNQLQIYLSGRPLVDNRARVIEYTAVTNLDKNVLYPGPIGPIDLDGFDITTLLQNGEVAGLVDVRDTLMVEEQAKLDEFANVLMREMNALLNSGASVPPPTSMEGSLEGLAIGDAIPAPRFGTFRIATTDGNGFVQNSFDFDLSTIPTVGVLITQINTNLAGDITASLGTDGQLILTADNAGEGISIAAQNGVIGPDAVGFSDYFGLNNMFDGTGADDIFLSQYLSDNPELLATGRLIGGPLPPSNQGVFVGDSSLASEMQDVFITNYSFNAAGNFAAQTESLSRYIDKIIGDTSYRANNAAVNRDINQSLLEQTKTSLENLSGVNVDEEMANLIDLEAKYEASATMIATIQELFDTLIAAVR